MKNLRNYLCLTVLMFVSVVAMAQENKVTVTGRDITTKQAFEQIEAQSKYTIAYNVSKFNAERKVSVNLKNKPLKDVLAAILKGSGFTYKVNENHIVIIPEPKETKTENQPEKTTQTIRGVVRDANSGEPLPFITVLLNNSTFGAVTDSLGNFRITNVPIGRYDLHVSSLGYEPLIVREQLLTSAKEGYNEVALHEQVLSLDEVVVRPPVNKEQPLNPMALAGARMFSVEETNRFAGGFDDPARLVSSFAGVAGNLATNSISVHGNSPQFLQWRLEGVEIPNPTHFADMTGLGGGIFTALSSQVMGNSDFFNGAFPAEYSNALSGVFDMSMRNGNNQKHEHTVQLGLLGLDLASEGPLSRKNGSSYIVNYRYSTTGLVSGLMGDLNLKYQDLSFKLNFPTRKAGIFSIWGLGLLDNNRAKPLEKEDWTTYSDREDVKTDLAKLAGGINHKIFLSKGTYLKSSLAATYSETKQYVTMIDNQFIRPTVDIKNGDWNLVFNSYINKKFSNRHTNRTGVTVTGLLYNLDFKLSETLTPTISPIKQVVKGDGSTVMVSAYSNSIFNITDKLSANVGLTAQLFTLNNNWAVEPRIGLKYKVAPNHALSAAYGLHSRREKLDYYFVKIDGKSVNTDLEFAKANHFVLSYDWRISKNIHLKVEPYYQSLFNVPVEDGTSFSIINYDLYYLDKALVNKGKGRNYGVDITLERYLDKGYYWLLSGSVFDSKYTGGDGIWRDTRYNRGYIINGLIGKEWMVGKRKQNIFSANLRLSYQGGDRYTPVDIVASEGKHDIVFDETRAFSNQFPAALTSDITVSYKINQRKTSHEFSLKVLNIGGYTGQYGYIYNDKLQAVEKLSVTGIVPNISYKIQF